MKFILHEIKLWFKDEKEKPKSYHFLPDKINVITGAASTGKSSFWAIIDYCLLSGEVKVANTINDNVLWFGIRFTINDREISIVRQTPVNGVVSADVFFNLGSFPETPESNKKIEDIKSVLDVEFGITDDLRFPYGESVGKTSFSISYRYFLLFNSLTETVIGAPETYFDTTFYGKEEYDQALGHIFDLIIGVNDMKSIKAIERINEIKSELNKIQSQERKNQTNVNNFEKEVFVLIDKCKNNNFIDYNESFDSVDAALVRIQEIISNTKKVAENSNLFSEKDNLFKKKREIQDQISAINQYQKEYDLYVKNLNKSADSLLPIDFLNKNLSDQLVNSYETKVFIDSLESSLKNIKISLSKRITEPLKVTGNTKELKAKIDLLDKRIIKLNEIKKNYLTEGQKFIELGKIEFALEQSLKRKINIPIDTVKLNRLNVEYDNLKKVPGENEHIKFLMKKKLDESIQRVYNQINSMPSYKNYTTMFDDKRMILTLQAQNEPFPLHNVGSKSNYMFMHLCVYLGLHEHMINVEQIHVPQFLYIDQPSIPYYSGDKIKGSDDKIKLLDAFTLLNSFVEYIRIEKKNNFQILLVEHAPKEYWEENGLENFHTVDEFIDGVGLIPSEVFNN